MSATPLAETSPRIKAWDLRDLVEWDLKIRAKADEFGLDCYPQEFELCDHTGMLGYMAYSGMPSHYPHWSYGKSYEKLKTLYDHGVSGLPYEMVINSNPAIAYLMRDNSLLLHILTIAHVYGHNDFFKNNFTFNSATRAELTIESFKAAAMRVRRYVEDPSIGVEKVERILDAAHALSWQCRRNFAIKKLSPFEQMARAEDTAQGQPDPFQKIHARKIVEVPDFHKVPLEPDEDILLFIRDHNPFLADFEKDLLTIVDQEAKYFISMMETKIMNEGWASYWHKKILESLDLDQGLHLEFIVNHNQVVRPIPGQINPYHLGLKIWEDIYRRYTNPTDDEIKRDGKPVKSGNEKIFEESRRRRLRTEPHALRQTRSRWPRSAYRVRREEPQLPAAAMGPRSCARDRTRRQALAAMLQRSRLFGPRAQVEVTCPAIRRVSERVTPHFRISSRHVALDLMVG